jgi:hypothetical protein
MRKWMAALLIGAGLGPTVASAQLPGQRPEPAARPEGGQRPVGAPARGPQGTSQGRVDGPGRAPPQGGDGGRRVFGGEGGPGRGPGFDRGPVVNHFNDRGGYGLGAGGRPDRAEARPDGPGRLDDHRPWDRRPDGDPARPDGGRDWRGGTPRDGGGVAPRPDGPRFGGPDRHDRDWRVDRSRPDGWDSRPDRPRFAGGPGDDRSGGGWNRGWRDDRRYDWRGWRQDHGDRFRGGGYRPPYGYGRSYRRYGVGTVIAPAFFAQDYWIADPYSYRLPPAYGPYRWVRYYADALLVDIYSGQVVDVIPGFFW